MAQKINSLFELDIDSYKDYCGIDEAGRGPIAGPLVVAGVILKKDIDGLNDSKKLTAKRREELYKTIKNNSDWFIYEIDSSTIDNIGLSKSIKEALVAIKDNFKGNKFIFDGNCTFGVTDIETLIKADQKLDNVKAASILAKVYRDYKMIDFAKELPLYGFEKHKGYGTKAHIEAIKRYGVSTIHRISFNFLK